jgi:hypothetical protein
MFIKDINNRLVLVNGSKKVLLPWVVDQLLNYDDSCYFVSEGMVCKYTNERRILLHPKTKVINLHQTQCSSRMVVVTYEDEVVILNPRVRLPNHGRVEYYSKNITIYKTDTNFILVNKHGIRILFPSVFNVRFINRYTDHIELHVFTLSNGILLHKIYDTHGNELWESSETICTGNLEYYYVHHRSSYHILSDGILYSFIESGERSQHQLDDYRIVDRCIIDYKKPIKLIDMGI